MIKRAALLIALIAAACGDFVDEPNPGSGMRPPDEEMESFSELTTSFDIHQLLTDDELEGGATITVTMVQAYLRQKGSFLAGYSDPTWGKTAAQLIVERSQSYGLSPLYMLARIQTESGLIQSGTSSGLVQATGCGCPDGSGCNALWRGFGNQVECSARKMRSYLDDLDAGSPTVSGWQVGVGKNTSDPCWVRPRNRATAALYTYTPWVGAYGRQCRVRTDIGGSTLVSLAYAKFAGEFDWSAGGGEPLGCASATVDQTLPHHACVQSASDAVWRQCNNGTWFDRDEVNGPACTVSWGWCTSGTLSRDVPARTCVQARWDQQWYQCGENAAFVLMPSGPNDSCASTHPLN
jgi:hypothetical protein